jgi:hypothetical protein
MKEDLKSRNVKWGFHCTELCCRTIWTINSAVTLIIIIRLVTITTEAQVLLWSVHVGFVESKMTMGQVVLQALHNFPLPVIILLVLHSHLLAGTSPNSTSDQGCWWLAHLCLVREL